MEIRCPHCGKKQSLSVAKLKASGGVVICPQCVSEFTVDLSQLPSEQPVADQASTQAPAQGEIAFCPSCGSRLPGKGLKFCPYCGNPLPMADAMPAPSVEGQTQGSAIQSSAAQSSGRAEGQSSAKVAEAATVEQRLTALPFIKTPDFITRHHEPASLRFSIVAWLVILALLFLFVLMLWKGNME